MPVIPLLARDLGFSVPMAAALTTIFGLTSFLGPIPAGRLISRIVARLALVITGALLVLSNLAAFAITAWAFGGGAKAHHRLARVARRLVMQQTVRVWQRGRQP